MFLVEFWFDSGVNTTQYSGCSNESIFERPKGTAKSNLVQCAHVLIKVKKVGGGSRPPCPKYSKLEVLGPGNPGNEFKVSALVYVHCTRVRSTRVMHRNSLGSKIFK